MTGQDRVLRTLDDAVSVFRDEISEDYKRYNLKEREFENSISPPGVSILVRDVKLGLSNHNIRGCEFYSNDRGGIYGTLIVDIDPDYNLITAASYYGIRSNTPVKTTHMGINMLPESMELLRKDPDAKVSFGRVDSHKVPFLGILGHTQFVDDGILSIFVRRYDVDE